MWEKDIVHGAGRGGVCLMNSMTENKQSEGRKNPNI